LQRFQIPDLPLINFSTFLDDLVNCRTNLNWTNEKLILFWKNPKVLETLNEIIWNSKEFPIFSSIEQFSFLEILKFESFIDRVEFYLSESVHQLKLTDQDMLHAYSQNVSRKQFNFNLSKTEELTVALDVDSRMWETRIQFTPVEDYVIYCLPLSIFFDKKKKLSMDEFKSLCESKYFSKTPKFLVITMMDLFEKILLQYDFKSIYPDFNSNEMSEKEFFVNFIQKEMVRKDVVIFETCLFDLKRNEFLMELVMSVLRGEYLNSYYPYHINKKLSLPKKIFDIYFRFK
jgi:hypothetical protein